MLKCKEATRLMSQAQDCALSGSERLSLTLHLAICGGCRNFRRQIAFLRQACSILRHRLQDTDDSAPPKP